MNLRVEKEKEHRGNEKDLYKDERRRHRQEKLQLHVRGSKGENDKHEEKETILTDFCVKSGLSVL